MKKIFYKAMALAACAPFLAGCNDFLDPDDDNTYKGEELETYIERAEGVLLNAYNRLPNTQAMGSLTDVATDNAVWNTGSGNSFRSITGGEWSSQNNPFNKWSSAYTAIGYCNLFLDQIVDNVEWAHSSEWLNEAFRERLTAEARGLRAYYYIELLTAHSGVGVGSGKLLGVPMIISSLSADDNLGYPRAEYAECVRLVLEDLEFAIAHLPKVYANNTDGNAERDRVYGERFRNRLNGRSAMALKARLLLQAASPAFNPSNDLLKWEAAAQAAAEFIDECGGLSAIVSSRVEFWLNDSAADIIWRKDHYTGRDWETSCFPPSLLGNGRVNPTQDLINAFPAQNGFPITMGQSGYAPTAPYAGRDPRLGKYIIYHGSVFKGNGINTIDGPADGIGRVPSSSTVTGYYMKKFMNETVNHVAGSVVTSRRFHTLIRMTEICLAYAEAANEAWGPDGTGDGGYSARQMMARLRVTAGITGDQYLPTVSSQAEMRKLIRNERRIELAFEGQRFWDLRRWNDEQAMMKPATGTRDGGITGFEVEDRTFMDYMIYGPVPYAEQQKGFEQNRGW